MNGIVSITWDDHGLVLVGVLLLQVLVVTCLAALIAFRRDPATRHGIWLCALACVLFGPLMVIGLDRANLVMARIPLPRNVMAAQVRTKPVHVWESAPNPLPRPPQRSAVGLAFGNHSHATGRVTSPCPDAGTTQSCLAHRSVDRVAHVAGWHARPFGSAELWDGGRWPHSTAAAPRPIGPGPARRPHP